MSLFKLSVRHMVSAVVLLGMTATPTLAVDLTGTWDGQAVCSGFFAGAKVKDTFSGLLTITQTGSDLNMEFLGTRYNGGIIDDSTNPTKKGQGSFVACSARAEPLADYNEQGHITVVTNGDKGTFKATSVFTTAVGGTIVTVETCKYTFKRTSIVDPAVPACPP